MAGQPTRNTFSVTSTDSRPSSTLNLAVRHEGIVGVDLQRIVLGGVEFDDGAAAHAQQMVDRHGGGAELDGDVDFNLIESVHI